MSQLRVLTIFVLLVLCSPLWAQEPASRDDVIQLLKKALAAHEAKDYEESERILKQVLALSESLEPRLRRRTKALAHYNLTCTLASSNDTERALDHLEEALKNGFRDHKHIEQDQDLEGLRKHPRFRTILNTNQKQHAEHESLSRTVKELYRQGRYIQALEPAKQFQSLTMKLFGEGHPETAISHFNLALLYRETGQYELAHPQFKRAIQLRRNLLGDNHPATAMWLNALAQLYQREGRYEKARRLFRKTLTIWQELDPPNVARGLNNLAFLHQELGLYSEALALFEQALQRVDANSLDATAMWNNMARIYQEMRQYDEALELFKRALKTRTELCGEEHPQTAQSINNLASLYQAMGRNDDALPLLIRSVDISKKVSGAEHPSTAASINNLGIQYHKMGQYRKGLTTLTHALEIRQKVLGRDHTETAASYSNLAYLYKDLGERDKAVASIRKAWSIWKNLDRMRVRSASSQGRYAYLETHIWHLKAYVELENDPTRQYNAMLSWKALGHHTASQLTNLFDAPDPQIRSLVEKIRTIEAQLAHLLFTPVPETLSESIEVAATDRLTGQLQQKRQQIEEELATHGIWPSKEIQAKDVIEAIPPDSVLVDIIRLRGRYLAWIVQKKLPIRKVILGPDVESSAAIVDSAVLAFRNTFATRKPNQNKQRAFRTNRASQNLFLKRGTALRNHIWSPITEALGSEVPKQVIISPDGSLCTLPFSLIPSKTESELLIDSHLFVNVISGSDLVRSLRASKNDRRRDLLAVGAIQYGELDSSRNDPLQFSPLPEAAKEVAAVVEIFEQHGLSTNVLLLEEATEGAFKKLAAGKTFVHLATHGFFLAEDPLSELGKANGLHDGHSTKKPGRKVNSNRLDLKRVRGSASRSRFWNPLLLSGLAFARANERRPLLVEQPLIPDVVTMETQDDGVLMAQEARFLDLSEVKLCVLSACETGIGEVQSGEGVLGLSSAFLVAGTENLVYSLWQVPDQDTSELMRDFYNLLLGEDMPSMGAALRKAQLSLLEKTRKRYGWYNPQVWGAWVIAGTPSPNPREELRNPSRELASKDQTHQSPRPDDDKMTNIHLLVGIALALVALVLWFALRRVTH